MKKRFLHPVWKFHETEKELVELEKAGWRLVKIHPFRCFEFSASAPKKVDYFFSCYMARDKFNMGVIDHSLKQEGAVLIGGSCGSLLTTIRFYRITKDIDLQEQRKIRDTFLANFLLKEAVLDLVLILLSLIPVIASFIFSGNPFGNSNWFEIGLMVFWYVFIVTYFVYNLYGYWYIYNKIK